MLFKECEIADLDFVCFDGARVTWLVAWGDALELGVAPKSLSV